MCGGNDLRGFKLGRGAVLQRCAECGTVSAPEYADPEDVYVDGYMFGGAGDFGLDVRGAASRTSWLGRSAPHVDHRAGYRASWRLPLDVGSGTGEVLVASRERGWRVQGVEPERTAAAMARERGLDVEVATLEESGLPERSFDLVSAFHVLEHIPDSRRFLRTLARWARPGGFVAIEVPNFDSLQRRRLGVDWPGLRPLEHIVHFTPATLERAFEGAGIAPVHVKTPLYIGPPQSLDQALADLSRARVEWLVRPLSRGAPNGGGDRSPTAPGWSVLRAVASVHERLGAGGVVVAIGRVQRLTPRTLRRRNGDRMSSMTPARSRGSGRPSTLEGRIPDLGGGSLRQHTARGVIINAVFQIGLAALMLLRRMMVAVFLTPAELGVWGIVIITVMTLFFLKNSSISDKFVQQSDADQEAAFQKALTFELGVTFVFVALVAVLLPVFAGIYDQPEIVAPALVMLPAVVGNSLQAPTWVFYRRMAFRRQRELQAIDPVVAFVVTIALAAAGAGYWSLIIGLVVGSWIGAAFAIRACPYKLRLRFDRGGSGTTSRFPGRFHRRRRRARRRPGVGPRGFHAVGIAGIGAISLAASVAAFSDGVDGSSRRRCTRRSARSASAPTSVRVVREVQPARAHVGDAVRARPRPVRLRPRPFRARRTVALGDRRAAGFRRDRRLRPARIQLERVPARAQRHSADGGCRRPSRWSRSPRSRRRC